VNINSKSSRKDTDYAERVDDNFLKNELQVTARGIGLQTWYFRALTFIFAIGAVYIAIESYPDAYILFVDCLVVFASAISLIYSETTLQLKKKSATPILMSGGMLKIRPTSIERLRGWNGLIDIKDISRVEIRTNAWPVSFFFFDIHKMTSEACELRFHTSNGVSRYSGVKPRETIDQVVKILTEDYGIRVA
jgi:hypothetical protein